MTERSRRQQEMKELIEGLAVESMASAALSHRKTILLTVKKLLTVKELLTERSRRQQGIKKIKEMLG